MSRRDSGPLAPCLVALAFAASADTVRLKNGRELTGLIVQEDASTLVLEIGVGSVTLRRSQVQGVERSAPSDRDGIEAEWHRKYYDHDKYAPPGFVELVRDFRAVRGARTAAVRAAAKSAQLLAENACLARQIEALETQHVEVNRRLAELSPPPGDVEAYNREVFSNNTLKAEMVVLGDRIERNRKDSGILAGSTGSYFRQLRDFEAAFAARQQAAGGQAGEEVRHLLASVGAHLGELQREFTRNEAPVTSSRGNVLVTARLNGRFSGCFIVDTGASVVTITEDTCRKLDLAVDHARQVNLVLADGRTISARPVVLASVEVGDARAEDVQAVVLTDPPATGVDGLLGMSFLHRFFIHIDAAGQTLVLERFQPR